MSRLLLPPSPRPSPLIRYFHLQLESSGIVRIPATPFPQVGVLLAGQCEAEVDGHPLGCAPRCFVSGPFSRPITMRLSPRTRFISALLRTGQLTRLFPLGCQRIADPNWPLEELAGRPEADALHDTLQAAPGGGQGEAQRHRQRPDIARRGRARCARAAWLEGKLDHHLAAAAVENQLPAQGPHQGQAAAARQL